MLDWFRKKLHALRARRRLEREVAPMAFHSMAEELRELTRVAQEILPGEHAFQTRVRRIREEMEQLDELARKPEFKRLPPQKRLELKQSLVASREQLIETVRTAPAPTETLQ